MQHVDAKLAMLSPALVLLTAFGCQNDPPPIQSEPDPPVALSSCFSDRSCERPLIVAHRGEGTGAPENSLAAIAAAPSHGADIVEVDVRESRDGVPILLHDSTLDRTTDVERLFPDRANADGEYPVSSFDLAELQQLTLSDDAELCTPENASEDTQRCRLPTLAEALALAKGDTLLMLDFKSAELEAVAEAILDEDAADTAFFFDADTDRLDRMESLVPDLVTMPRAQDAASTSALVQTRRPFAVHIDPGYVQEAAAAAEPEGVKVFVNGFVDIDLYLIGFNLGGDDENYYLAQDATAALLDAGADIIQTNQAPLLAQILSEL